VQESGLVQRGLLHGCVRLAVKFDFLRGLLLKGLKMTRRQRAVRGADQDRRTVRLPQPVLDVRERHGEQAGDLAGRHTHEVIKLRTAEQSGVAELCEQMVGQAMADDDTSGWRERSVELTARP
jgi:hypothetical protein